MIEWILEACVSIELWVIAHYKVISFVFGLFAAIGVGAGIIYKSAIVMRNNRLDREAYKDALNKQLVELSHEAALFNQRQEFQSEFMSYQEKRYLEMQSENIKYGTALVNNAIDSALCKQIIQSNNVTVKD